MEEKEKREERVPPANSSANTLNRVEDVANIIQEMDILIQEWIDRFSNHFGNHF